MSRVSENVIRAFGRLKTVQGVSITYTRDRGTATEQSVALVAVPARERLESTEPGRVGAVRISDRDYLILVSDLAIGGRLTVPTIGDRITETIAGVEQVYEIRPRDGDGPWQHNDHTKTIYRVHTERV
jgi:hypothetical protein